MDPAQTASSPVSISSLPTASGNPQSPLVPSSSSPISSGRPEVKPGFGITTPEFGSERLVKLTEIPDVPEIGLELQEHIQAVQAGEVQLPGPIDVGTHEGQPVSIQPPAPQQPNIVLPVTQDDFQLGQTQPVSSAFRWLVEWVGWIIKKYPGRVLYRTAS